MIPFLVGQEEKPKGHPSAALSLSIEADDEEVGVWRASAD